MNTDILINTFKKIAEERQKQDQKWGEQNHNDEIWHLILAEEFGEISGDICKMRFDVKNGRDTQELERNLDKELVQAAAVIFAWIEARERRKNNMTGWKS